MVLTSAAKRSILCVGRASIRVGSREAEPRAPRRNQFPHGAKLCPSGPSRRAGGEQIRRVGLLRPGYRSRLPQPKAINGTCVALRPLWMERRPFVMDRMTVRPLGSDARRRAFAGSHRIRGECRAGATGLWSRARLGVLPPNRSRSALPSDADKIERSASAPLGLGRTLLLERALDGRHHHRLRTITGAQTGAGVASGPLDTLRGPRLSRW